MSISNALTLLIQSCDTTFTALDVGARWGIHKRWLPVLHLANFICFEPDFDECQRFAENYPPNIKYLPIALAGANEIRDIYVTANYACSSLYRPIEALSEHYSDLTIMRTQEILQVPCRRLDELLAEMQIDAVAIIKLDTQGSELEILQAARKTLETCALVDLEVQFNPLYHGAGLFGEVDCFLREQGFVLWRFENLSHYAEEILPEVHSEIVISTSPNPQELRYPAPNGQLFFGQAQYVRSEYPRTADGTLTREAALVPAIVSAIYGFWDLSLEIIRKTGDLALLSALREALTLADTIPAA